MDPFNHGPLRHFTEKLRDACPSKTAKPLPDVLVDSGPSGKAARNLLPTLSIEDQEVLAEYCTKKLRKPRWAEAQHHREIAKVVLDEVSISAVGAAQELGLTLCTTLNKVRDPWMRIQVNLTLAELLSRTHTYAPSCALAYVQTFRQFDTYLARRGYERGPTASLFEPIALGQGDSRAARDYAVESVLPYGENCLRLLWGLQRHDAQTGNKIGVKTLRSEEVYIAHKLRGWIGLLQNQSTLPKRGWYLDLVTALDRSDRGEGPKHTCIPDSARSRAVARLMIDVRKLVSSGELREAERILNLLQPALASDRDLHFTTLRNHFVHVGYLHATVIFRLHKGEETQCSRDPIKDKVRRLWRETESLYTEPGALWPRVVERTRSAALSELPKEWRYPPAPFRG